jgi:pimeloyl-ACP methyl ester carboxylesterase
MRDMFDQKVRRDDPVKVPAQALMAKWRFWSDDYREFVKKLVPGLDYRAFDSVGHFLFLEKPKEFHAALTEFLQMQETLK